MGSVRRVTCAANIIFIHTERKSYAKRGVAGTPDGHWPILDFNKFEGSFFGLNRAQKYLMREGRI